MNFRPQKRAKYWKDLQDKLPTLLEDLDPNQLDIVKMRWLEPAKHYDRLWFEHRLIYYGFRVPIIIGAATVPVLASLEVPALATALVGLGVAILTGLDSFFRYGLRWQQQRRAAATLEAEGWQFLELSGPYAEPDEHKGDKGEFTHKTAYTKFLGRLETLNRQLATRYLDLFLDEDGKHQPEGDSGRK